MGKIIKKKGPKRVKVKKKSLTISASSTLATYSSPTASPDPQTAPPPLDQPTTPPTLPTSFNDYIESITCIINGDGRMISSKADDIFKYLMGMYKLHSDLADKVVMLNRQIAVLSATSSLKPDSITLPPIQPNDKNIKTKTDTSHLSPLQSSSPNSATTSNQIKTFASVLQKASNSDCETAHVIQVFPKVDSATNKATSSTATKQTLFNTVDISKLKIGVKRTKLTRDGSVTLFFRSASEVATLAGHLHDHKYLTCKVPAKKNPVFTFFMEGKDIPNDLPSEILAKNDFIPQSDTPQLTILHSRTTKNGNTIITMQVNPPTYHAIIANNSKLFIGWNYVSLREQDPTLQCRNCFRFGHKSAHCHFKIDDKLASRCKRCSGNHTDPCSEPLKCGNCHDHNQLAKKRKWTILTTGHLPDDPTCPMLLKAQSEAKQFVNYG